MRKFVAILSISATLTATQLFGFPNHKPREAQAHCRVWHPHHCSFEEVIEDVGNTIDRHGLSVIHTSLAPVTGYLEYLYQQGNGRWKTLPNDFKACYRAHYKIDLDKVKYATEVNTIHGQGITVGDEIYFPRNIDLNNRVDRFWMLHELAHVRQYRVVGGVSSFITKYVVQGGIEIGKNGSINIHDNIELEREADSKANSLINTSCSPNPPQSFLQNPVLDPDFYLLTYGDLRHAYGHRNPSGARQHWTLHGISEARRSSPAFDVRYYRDIHSDLREVFGNDYYGVVDHWLRHGIQEGRRSSLVFDVKYYLGKYPDLQKAFGAKNYSAAVDHWLRYGVSEGRQGSPDFAPIYYLSNNPDVANVYGANNYMGAIAHYLEFGRREGRRGAP